MPVWAPLVALVVGLAVGRFSVRWAHCERCGGWWRR